MAKENAVMGRIGLIYNHDRSIECRIQCTEIKEHIVIGISGRFLSIDTGRLTRFIGMSDMMLDKFSYHPEVKKYKQTVKKFYENNKLPNTQKI